MAEKRRRSRVFVGSSFESLDYARAIQNNLDSPDVSVTVWQKGVFNIAAYGLESALAAVKSHDFGVFVFAPDDQIIIRNQKHRAVRDNVIFELGLFMGGLGRERAFVVAPSGVDLHLPADLMGWNVARYHPSSDPKDHVSTMGVACNQIRDEIHRLGNFRPGSPTENVSTIVKIVEDTLKQAYRIPDFSRRRLSIIKPGGGPPARKSADSKGGHKNLTIRKLAAVGVSGAKSTKLRASKKAGRKSNGSKPKDRKQASR